jgi:hypothetical protein
MNETQSPLPAPPPETVPPRRGSPATLLLAAALLLALAVGLAAIVTASLGPVGIAIVLIAAGVFVVAGLQYLLWGWWLGKRIRQWDREQE